MDHVPVRYVEYTGCGVRGVERFDVGRDENVHPLDLL